MLEWVLKRDAEAATTIATNAAAAGLAEVLRWLSTRGSASDDVMQAAVSASAREGQVDALRYALEYANTRDAKLQVHFYTCAFVAAAAGGHVLLLDFVAYEFDRIYAAPNSRARRRQEQRKVFDPAATIIAGRNGHVRVLEWLHKNGCEFPVATAAAAGEQGQLAALEWLHAHRKPMNRDVCLRAAQRGHVHVLEFAVCTARLPVNRYTCRFAAYGGQLATLRWLVEVANCKLDDDTAEVAAAYGHLDVLRYVMDNCEVSDIRFLLAKARHHPAIYAWLSARLAETEQGGAVS